MVGALLNQALLRRSIAVMAAAAFVVALAAAGVGVGDYGRPAEWHFDRGVCVSSFMITITRMIDTRVNGVYVI